MAKAKKQTTGEQPDAAASQPPKPAAAAAKKPAAGAKKAPGAKKAAAGAAPAAPLIDTSLAAQAAARMVANRDLRSAPQAEKQESGSFKQLKESLNRPAVQGPGGLLQNIGNPKKSNQAFGGRNQVGRNQTFGADVNRAGVPRRTGGG